MKWNGKCADHSQMQCASSTAITETLSLNSGLVKRLRHGGFSAVAGAMKPK